MAWLRSPYLTAASAALGWILSGASLAADTRAANGDLDRAMANPRLPGGENAPPVGGRDFGPPPPTMPPGANGASDFPDDQVQDWVVACARAARTRALFRRAENDLNAAVRDAQWNFEQSQDNRDAVAAEKRAYDAYTAERRRALESVVNDPQYKAALELRDEMGDRIAKLRASSKPGQMPREILLAMASQKLQYATRAHEMETSALEKDAPLQEARQKMVQASARVSELRSKFDTSVRSNPQIQQARRNLEDARVALITAEAYENAAAAAGSVATDYAYYRHRWDFVPQYTAPWGPYGYR